jgi:TM2 domain-containing membrane protein YozV
MPRKRRKSQAELALDAGVAGVLAWIVPGAGHLYLRRPVRGIIIFVTIAALFWGGVAMGGVLTVDQYNERWWFAAQMLAGIHGLTSWQRQTALYDRMMNGPDGLREPLPDPGGEISLAQLEMDEALARDKVALVAPTDTVARAYAGVAGMLNLMCIFDAIALALIGTTGESRSRRKEPDADEQESS